MVWEYAEYLQDVANGLPVTLPQGYFATLIVIGAVMGLIAISGGGLGFALLGGMIGIGGTIGVYSGNWQNLKEGRESNAPIASMAVGDNQFASLRVHDLVN
jgi:hypothetical protein